MKKITFDVKYVIDDEVYIVEQTCGERNKLVYTPVKTKITGISVDKQEGFDDLIFYYVKDQKRPVLDRIFDSLEEAAAFAESFDWAIKLDLKI